MATGTDGERERFLAAIQAAPEDRTARLVHADHLQEHDEPDKAEFVRVRCKLVECGHQPGTCQDHECRCMSWARRSRELLTAHEGQWRAVGPCETCGGKGFESFGHIGCEECTDCWLSGDRGGLLREFLYPTGSTSAATGPSEKRDSVRIDWSRYPLLALRVPRLSDCIEEDHAPGITMYTHYRPTPWLAAVVRHHPEVIGIEPQEPINSLLDELSIAGLSIAAPVHNCMDDDACRVAIGRTVVQFARDHAQGGADVQKAE